MSTIRVAAAQSPRTGRLQEEWQHILVDDSGRKWKVTQAVYDQAEIGQEIRLRQWVDEWRPCR